MKIYSYFDEIPLLVSELGNTLNIDNQMLVALLKDWEINPTFEIRPSRPLNLTLFSFWDVMELRIRLDLDEFFGPLSVHYANLIVDEIARSLDITDKSYLDVSEYDVAEIIHWLGIPQIIPARLHLSKASINIAQKLWISCSVAVERFLRTTNVSGAI